MCWIVMWDMHFDQMIFIFKILDFFTTEVYLFALWEYEYFG